MLLTITYKGPNATDLGFLLHKNPARPQTVELSFGKAQLFYPVAEKEICTAALLLDLNPVDLARGRQGAEGEGGLFDYVNDRPYAATSFLSTAIARAFGTAMGGRCEKRPKLAASPLPLCATISTLPCRGGEAVLKGLFEPLGYAVEAEGFPLDVLFPEWGQSRYYNVTLRGTKRLCELLTHLYVLIPVLDSAKHYWIGEDEIEKLMRHGEGWLAGHPMKEYIVSHALKRRSHLVNAALRRLDEEEEEDEIPEEGAESLSLNQRRLNTVAAALKNTGARRVLDLGCGEGRLLSLLKEDSTFTRIAGMDVSSAALSWARERLRMDRMSESQKERFLLFQGSLTYRDKRLSGYDAFALVEVIEHIDPGRLPAFERVVFGDAAPNAVVLTTPNREYNARYEALRENALRHQDHRFEWTRAEFRAWATRVAATFGYQVSFSEIGDADPAIGAPTQMGVFTK